mgnify:CR=1 FL=1
MKCFSFSILLLCLQCQLVKIVTAADVPLFSLPEVDFSDLTVQDELAVSSVANALTTGTMTMLYPLFFYELRSTC